MASTDEERLTVGDDLRTPSPPSGSFPARDVVAGVLLLATTKAGDVLSTFVGLSRTTGLREGNPLVAAAMTEAGPLVALLMLAAFTVAVIAAVTETAVFVLRRRFGVPAGRLRHVRVVGYGVPAVLNLGITAHNVALIASL